MSDRRPIFASSMLQLDAGVSTNTGRPVVRFQAHVPEDRGTAKAITVGLDRASQIIGDLQATAQALRQAFGPAGSVPAPQLQPAAPAKIAAKQVETPTVAKPAAAPPAPPAATRKRETLSFGLNLGKLRILRAIDVILHVGDGVGAEYHVDLWLDYLQRSGALVLVVVRSLPVMEKLAELPNIDVVFVKEARDAETLIASCTRLKAVFYTSNTGNVIHFVRFNHLSHIFLGHGDSEKAASCHKFFRVYDEIWTAGQAHIDRFRDSGIRFAGLDARIVGRPQMRAALRQARSQEPTGTFLYLPTWEGFHDEQNYSSLPIGPTMVAAVSALAEAAPRVKFHPWTGKQAATPTYTESGFVSAYSALAERPEMLDRGVPATHFMIGSDFLITDISSVITDYLVVGNPIFMYVPKAEVIRTAASRIVYTDYVYPFGSEDELVELVRRVIVEKQDNLAEARRKALAYFIDVDRTLDETFEAEVRRVIAGEGGETGRDVEISNDRIDQGRAA